MTKRLFAVVLAAVLAIAMFTFPVAAAGVNVNAALTNDGTRLKLSYTSGESVGDDCTKVQINYLLGNSIAKTVTYTSKTDLKKDAHDFATSVGGEYKAQVFWYNGSVQLATYTTATVTVPITTSGTNMKVVYDSNGITLEFNAQKDVSTYKIEYTYKSGNSTITASPVAVTPVVDSSTKKATCRFTPICSYSELATIKIYSGVTGGWANNSFASWTNRNVSGGGSSSTSTGDVQVSGNIEAYVSNGYLYVTINDTQYNYYRYTVINGATTSPTPYNLGNVRTFQIYLNNANSSYLANGFYVVVEGSYSYNQSNYGWNQIGTATVTGYYNTGSTYPWYYPNYNYGTYGVQLSNSNGYVVAQWAPVTGAMGYYITSTNAAGQSTVQNTPYTYFNLPFSTSDTGYKVEVRAVMGDNSVMYVGVAYANNTNTNTNTSGITKTQIKGLTITSTSSISTTLSWNRYTGASYYYIIYGGLNGSNLSENVAYSTSATIPYGPNADYQATVYAMDGSGRRIATVGYVYYVPGTTADAEKPATTGKAYPSNLTAKSSNKRITLSWKAPSGASSYTIYYKRSANSSWLKINTKVTKTSVNINGLTNDISYDFKVVPNKGSESSVISLAPSASTSRTVTAVDPNFSNDGDGDISLEDDVLTITSVSSTSKGKIKITWNDVDAPSYKIYIAQGTSNTYKPCGTYTGTSATLSSFGTGSSATSFKSGTVYKVRIVRTDYSGTLKEALKACAYKSVTVK